MKRVVPMLLLSVLTLLLSVPVSAQWQPPRTSDGQPDMQGIWQRAAGRPVRSLEGDHSRWEREYGVILAPAAADADLRSYIDTPDGKIPYQAWAAAKLTEFRANVDAPTKLEHIDPHYRAWSDGVPRINNAPGVLQVLQAPGCIVMLYESNHTYRIIPLDGRPHIGGGLKLFMGDSRGRWEGNTLVVDVTNQNDRTWLDSLSFHGDGLHVVERWTLVSPDRIDYRATFIDPTMFTQAWSIAYSFDRDKTQGFEIWEDARHEGERDVERILRGGGIAGRRKE